MPCLYLRKIAPQTFLATQGATPAETWTSLRLRSFLVTHGYDDESAEWIVEQAEAAPQIEVNLPEPSPPN